MCHGEKMPKPQVRKIKWTKKPVSEDDRLIDASRGIFMVADGMGGHPAPVEASRFAVDACYSRMIQDLNDLAQLQRSPPDRIPVNNMRLLFDGMQHAQRALCTLSDYMPKHFRRGERTAGTTLDVCYIRDGMLYVGHIGDGAVFLFRDNTLEQLTEEHSLVDPTLAGLGAKYAEIAGNGGVSRYIGDPDGFDPQFVERQLNDNDVVLLTTDGLTKFLLNHEIQQTLIDSSFGSSARELLKRVHNPGELIQHIARVRDLTNEQALQYLRDRRDDVTIMLVKYGAI